MSTLDFSQRPSLPKHVRLKIDAVSGDPVLLFPEGLLVLNSTAHEIVRHCDGQTTLEEILRQLGEEFDVAADVLRDDVCENLEQLRRKNLLVFSP